jgi:hypothetical protein
LTTSKLDEIINVSLEFALEAAMRISRELKIFESQLAELQEKDENCEENCNEDNDENNDENGNKNNDKMDVEKNYEGRGSGDNENPNPDSGIPSPIGYIDPMVLLLSIPYSDEIILFYKMRLWRSLHQVLISIPFALEAAVDPDSDSLSKSLRKSVQIGIMLSSGNKVLQQFEDRKGRGTFLGAFLSSKERLSISLLAQLLDLNDEGLSISLRDMLTECASSGFNGSGSSYVSGSGMSSASSSASSSNNSSASSSSSSDSNSSASPSTTQTPTEHCSICSKDLTFSEYFDDPSSSLLTCLCPGCGIASDRCCITLLAVGFSDIVSGNVLKCPLCQSVGLSNMKKNHLIEDVTNTESLEKEKEKKSRKKAKTDDFSSKIGSTNIIDNSSSIANESMKKEFDWSWWGDKAPYCPFCAVLMLPLT